MRALGRVSLANQIFGSLDPSNRVKHRATGRALYSGRQQPYRKMPLRRAGILVGDIAHNLRSALDHLIWQLSLIGTGGENQITRTPRLAQLPRFEYRFSARSPRGNASLGDEILPEARVHCHTHETIRSARQEREARRKQEGATQRWWL